MTAGAMGKRKFAQLLHERCGRYLLLKKIEKIYIYIECSHVVYCVIEFASIAVSPLYLLHGPIR